jgi:hypothetical protein
MALGAMLGGEVFQGHFEHVVAANADAVDFLGGRRVRLGGISFRVGLFRLTQDSSFSFASLRAF